MKKRISLIYPFAYGYVDCIVNELQSYSDILVTDIKTDTVKYKYPNLVSKVWNGITKVFGKNVKEKFLENYIHSNIEETQDIILIIRPDLLKDSFLRELKAKTNCFIAYYYDSCKKYPRQVHIAAIFDEVYSYEAEDIQQYGFKETTNFIYDTACGTEEIQYDIFNISSFDSRIKELKTLAQELTLYDFKINFILFWFKKLNLPHFQTITAYFSLQETKELMLEAKAILDVQRSDQTGLSFRTFESLGYRRKLITTNAAVKNFDFYHANNILVIDSQNLNVDEIKYFLELPYVDVSEAILNKYKVEAFVKKIFKI